MASLQDDHDAVVERFRPTSGLVTGWMTVVLAAVVVVAGVAYADEGFPLWVAAASVVVGVLAWAAMLRPALWVTEEHLVMQNLGETVHIRLAAVEEMAVRQMLVVRAADRRFVSTVIGRSLRKSLSAHQRPDGLTTDSGRIPMEGIPYADFAEGRIRELIGKAREREGVRARSQEQRELPDAVRREPALLPLAVIAASLVLLGLSFFF